MWQQTGEEMQQTAGHNVGATVPTYNNSITQRTIYSNRRGQHPYETQQEAAGHNVGAPAQMYIGIGHMLQQSGRQYAYTTQGQNAAANSTQASAMENRGKTD